MHQNLQSVQDNHHTLRVFYKKLIWSFQALWEGEDPVKDWLGNPIPGAVPVVKMMGGFFMCVWALIFDLDHGFKCYSLPNPNSNTPCSLCPCNTTSMPWFDFRMSAGWLNHIWTLEGWLAAGMKRSLIFDIVGVSCLSVYPDWMHCKSLGIDKPLIGATCRVIWEPKVMYVFSVCLEGRL